MKPLNEFINKNRLLALFDLCMEEDGAKNDHTSNLTIPKNAKAKGVIKAKEDLRLAGLEAGLAFFSFFDSDIIIKTFYNDGDSLKPQDVAATITGATRTLLAVERSALNLLQHLSGIATQTALYVRQTKGTAAKVLDTRKTIPGLRRLEKFAVHCGGGYNHRMGLSDAILIKDNHVLQAGGVGKGVLRVKSSEEGVALFIEVEVSNMRELEEALDSGADRALLDNMTPDEISKCVKRASGRIELEASGNINLDNIRDFALTGVDYISCGALTHSAKAVDLNMKIEPLD